MTEDKKLPKIEFEPGCFDGFEGTQEELVEFMAEITKMFEGKTPEDLKAMGRPLYEKEFDDLPEDVKRQLEAAIKEGDAPKRTLN